ncbi:homocysteine S-methyltransferase family protein [Micromonospora echinofusca]|uniref:Homocysteine S-methyltransferase family protein n=1 Tax=Micromonospora echinofusca TaxID=47858 RepID=A0ABS3VN36_MICEH|nr:homocysteine S-methyltransferase family protein [Micromonospora echinofusca]MBO4205901.1 homocysteine S-methyltransferase family protein [Micromonospora echinofusca]
MPTTTLLDGGIATELQRHGWPVRAPWWGVDVLLTPAGRTLLGEVHRRYADAGAEVLSAHTFRTNLRNLRRAGLADDDAARLVHTAVGVARAAAPSGVRVAGSIAPVEDCYQPRLVPPDDELRVEHRWLARHLHDAGVDLVLVETMNTLREAVHAVEAVTACGMTAWVSFVCTEQGTLLSGEPLDLAARTAQRAGARTVLVNCTTPTGTGVALRMLADAGIGPVGAYPNLEDRSGLPAYTPVDRHVPAGTGTTRFAAGLAAWRAEFDLVAVGGCCGATPAHVAALNRAVAGGTT